MTIAMPTGGSLKILVDFYCIESKEKGTIELDLDPTGKSVLDLKIILQNLLKSPASSMKICYEDNCIKDKDIMLEQIHLRDQDRIYVEFPAVVDVETLDELISNLKYFLGNISLPNKNFIDADSDFLDDINYAAVKETLRRLSLCFTPWKSKITFAHREYFEQEGGLDAFLDIFRFSALEIKSSEPQSDNNTHATRLSTLNGHQKALNILCLRLLWNFIETKQDQLRVLHRGSVQKLVVDALLLDPDKSFSYCVGGQMSSLIAFINQEAIGCLAGLAEASSATQEAVARNGLVVRKLLIMLDRRGHKALTHYSIFSSQMASIVLFISTLNPLALKFLIQKGVHYKMMRVAQRLLGDKSGDLALRYYCILFLAKVRVSPGSELQDDGSAQTIDRIIDRFLCLHEPCEVVEWEQEHGCHWATYAPYIELAYCGGKYCKCDVTIAMMEATDVPKATKACSRESCTGSKSKKSKSKESWCCEAALYENIEISATDPAHTEGTNSCLCLEKLGRICLSEAKWPGSFATQRLGLFSLQCVLCCNENWESLVEQGLLPYLVVLSWHLRPRERDKLKQAFGRYALKWDPPSLKIIVKSLLSKPTGFSVTYRY
ncbi:uncharacterized protein LOC5506411 [Nematostella vectensis]|uniref:uncharacterized protein LOC5506411 n=1 Tax=Nematostella vectensis TaxID=45351 RepID=UPI002076E2E4|nr:uncharacterized protein LOC5506411 [Nematostella vectensis]